MSPHIALMKFLSRAAVKLGIAKHTYVVGGAVRNFVIQQPIKDIDVVIDSVALKGKDSEWFAKQLQQEIPAHTSLVTNQYGVAILTVAGDWVLDTYRMKGEVIEIANAREESYGVGGKGYKPSDVKPASIEADIYRREFTFNTLMWRLSDLADGPDKAEILDLTGCGLADLKAGEMACPSDPDKTFSDDPTRMLRAIKFLVRYGFEVKGAVADSIRRNASKLRSAPQEAIAVLLMSEILHEKSAALALQAMKKLGLLAVIAEMLMTDKGFARTLANWANDKRVAHLFDLLDHGLPLATPLDFLSTKDQAVLRRVAATMPTGEAERLLGVLRQPTKALGDKDFVPKLAAARGITGKQIGDFAKKISMAVRAALLDNPELLGQPDALKEIARGAVTEKVSMFNRAALEQLVEAKDPPIMGLGSKWHIKSKKEASWSPEKDHLYRIHLERGGWEFSYFAPGARVGERSGPKTTFVHGYKAADAAEADWKERSSKKTEAKLDEAGGGHHFFDGKNYFADTAFLQQSQDVLDGMELVHQGYGDFELRGEPGRISFTRVSGKDFPGQSGRSHEMDDNKGGKLIKALIAAMEKANRSELVKESLDEKSPPGWEGTVQAMKKHPVKKEEGLHSAVAGLRSVLIHESVSRYCEIWKASNDKWYLNLAPDEHGEYDDADTYGPFSSESAAEKYLDKFSNPGAMDVDDSGTRPPPEKAPNGSPVRKPR
jgi:tRNA nucleotidyltransferase/poly(A) polymerase